MICVALLAHGGLTIIAFVDHGYAVFFPPFTETNSTQICSNLVLGLSLVNVWVYFDLKRRNKPVYWFTLHLFGTALAGTFAPLAYLLMRGDDGSFRCVHLEPANETTD